MHGMSWPGFVTGAADACMMSLLLRARWAARPEAASVGTPLGQDGRPSTCAISGPIRPPGTFDTPNCTVSSVPVGWWRSGAANRKAPVDFFFYSDMKPGVFMVPRAAGSLLKNTILSLQCYLGTIRAYYSYTYVNLDDLPAPTCTAWRRGATSSSTAAYNNSSNGQGNAVATVR
jgi:hypothetical protein